MLKRLILLLFCTITGALFIYLNKIQPHYFIDEVFHIPQTLRYCHGNFTQWDTKITTFPGLYLMTALILGPFNFCNITSIRCTNLIGTLLNLYLLYEIIRKLHKTKRKNFVRDEWIQLITVYNIALFPPLFFWFFLYYTDVLSVTSILLVYLLHLHKRYHSSALVGALSIFMRQTNIVWVGFLASERAFDLFELKARKPIPQKFYTSPMYMKFLRDNMFMELHRGPISFARYVISMAKHLFGHISICLLFLTFVIWNEGIVIGDRTAHKPTIHIPQIFYFTSFTFCFSWPYMLPNIKKFVHLVQKHLTLSGLVIATMIVIVHLNTLVHPYVLADNRHYVFYIWNRFMGRYVILKYLLVIVYAFTIYSFLMCINHLRFPTQLMLVLLISGTLMSQLLLEPRYFIIPYIFFRLNVKNIRNWQIAAETITTLIINSLQFYIFVNKTFYWDDLQYPQRISW